MAIEALPSATAFADELPNGGIYRHIVRVAPWMVLIVCLLLTWSAWLTAGAATQSARQSYFDFRMRESMTRIAQRMQTYEQVLKGVQGLYQAADNVTRGEFRDYVVSLQLAEHYPGIQGVGFSLIVPAAVKDRHLNDVRKQGFPTYDIFPPGVRETYTSIIHLEPFSGRNLRAFGYDMYSEPIRRAAMDAARDSNNASISGMVRLVQESGQQEQAGFLMYLPIYRKGAPRDTLMERRANIVAWAYAPFRMDDLMKGIQGELADDLDLEIFDGERLSIPALMYDSDTSRVHKKSIQRALEVSQVLDISGRRWTINVSARPGLANRLNSHLPLQVGLTGGVVSLLLTWVTWLLVTGRERAIRTAKAMNMTLIRTENLFREQSRRLEEIIWGTDIGTWEWNVQTGETVFNERWAEIVGYSLEELAPVSIETWRRLVHPEDGKRSNDLLERCFRHEVDAYECDARMRHKNGNWVWVLDRGRVVEWTSDNRPLRMSGTHQDITDRKLAEEIELRSAREFKSLVSTTTDGFWVIGTDARFIEVNDAYCEMIGYSREELLTMSASQIKEVNSVDDVTPRMALLMKQGSDHFETTHQRKDGQLIDVDVSVTLVPLTERLFAFVRDITERKKTQERIKHYIDQLEHSTESTLHAVALMVEQRDPYTAGHERRVGELAAAIATEMGLPEDTARGVRLTGYVHDIGKISVPAELLSKPSKLSQIELALIKIHAQVGYEILKDVDFPWPIAEVIRQHHERLDGSGYPRGLKADEILLEARIISVADVVEALSSHRPYRPGLGIESALDEIEKQSGKLYDATVVAACLRLFHEKGYSLPA